MKHMDVVTRRFDPGAIPFERLEPGNRIEDCHEHKFGTVLDFACQYAHPKAAPVYNYLVRWDDGQIQAMSERSICSVFGVRPVD